MHPLGTRATECLLDFTDVPTCLSFRVCLSPRAANLLRVGIKVSLYLYQNHLLKCGIATNVPWEGDGIMHCFFFLN